MGIIFINDAYESGEFDSIIDIPESSITYGITRYNSKSFVGVKSSGKILFSLYILTNQGYTANNNIISGLPWPQNPTILSGTVTNYPAYGDGPTVVDFNLSLTGVLSLPYNLSYTNSIIRLIDSSYNW